MNVFKVIWENHETVKQKMLNNNKSNFWGNMSKQRATLLKSLAYYNFDLQTVFLFLTWLTFDPFNFLMAGVGLHTVAYGGLFPVKTILITRQWCQYLDTWASCCTHAQKFAAFYPTNLPQKLKPVMFNGSTIVCCNI